MAAERAYQKQLEKETREEQLARRKEERDEQRMIRKEKRDFDAVRRREASEAISDAAKVKAMSMADLQKIIMSHYLGSFFRFRGALAIQDMYGSQKRCWPGSGLRWDMRAQSLVDTNT